MEETLVYQTGPDDDGVRLDRFVGARAEVGSRARASQLIERGCVIVDGAPRPKSYRLSPGQRVFVGLVEDMHPEPMAEELPVDVVYEDEWLLIVDKPAGMVVHPSRGHPSGTLVNALQGRGIAGGDVGRPGIVHRLDRDTSGLLIVAKEAEAHRRLQEMIRARRVERRYLAMVHGRPGAESGTIEAPVGRDPHRRTNMAVGGTAARDAVTHFRVLEGVGDHTVVEVRLETGRTHQIRVHFLAIGHPVVGDPVYARRDTLRVGRQFLHSAGLRFVHPMTGAELSFESPLPPDLAAALERARGMGRAR